MRKFHTMIQRKMKGKNNPSPLEQVVDEWFDNYKEVDKEHCMLSVEQAYEFARHIAGWQVMNIIKNAQEGEIAVPVMDNDLLPVNQVIVFGDIGLLKPHDKVMVLLMGRAEDDGKRVNILNIDKNYNG